MSDVAELVREVKQTREQIEKADAERTKVFEELRGDIAKHSASQGETEAKLTRIAEGQATLATKQAELEAAINEHAKVLKRPGQEQFSDEANRKAAIGLLELKHQLQVVKKDNDHPFAPTEEQIAEASIACKSMNALINSTDVTLLGVDQRKALSSFMFGSNGFILSPQMSSVILSCLVDQSDVTGLMQNLTISGPSVKFLIDNVLLDNAAWACDTQCFANNPQPLIKGLGELEIKPETLRYIICATRDILEDASVNIEQWMLNKVNRAFRNTISTAIISGSGVGMPIGILNPVAGIPICDVSDATAAGQFTWQDLVMLKWQVPMQWQGGGKFLMNQNTFGLTLTMSDAMGRPIMTLNPLEAGQFLTSGSPIQIVTQMPDAVPGATPVAYGNWNQTYMVVNRKAVTMQQDPYSAGFCILFKFESRVGGAVICPQAARLMRIK